MSEDFYGEIRQSAQRMLRDTERQRQALAAEKERAELNRLQKLLDEAEARRAEAEAEAKRRADAEAEAKRRAEAEAEANRRADAEKERQRRVEAAINNSNEAEKAKNEQFMKDYAEANKPVPGPEIKRQSPSPGPEVKVTAPPPAPDKDLSAECRRFFERIQGLNGSAAARHASLMKEVEAGTSPQRQGLILDALKLCYGEEITLTARTNCLREELREMLAACKAVPLPECFQARLRALIESPNLTALNVSDISREFDELAAAKPELDGQADARAKRAVLENFSAEAGKILKEMGYQVMDSQGLPLDQTHYLATPDPDCRIQFYINSQSGKMTFKQVRVVASEAEAAAQPSDYQKALDQKKGEKWCQTFDRLRERLDKAGYSIDTMSRREPGQGELPVVIDKRLAERRQEAASAPKAQEQNRS